MLTKVGLAIATAVVTLSSILGAPMQARAAPITSDSDTHLSGSSTITFSEVSQFTKNPTIAGVSFAGIGADVWTQEYNGANLGLRNVVNIGTPENPGGVPVRITFSQEVSAFGIGLSVVNRPASLSAYDGSSNLLGTVDYTTQQFGQSGYIFRGLGGFPKGIAYALINTTDSDVVFADNLEFVPLGSPAAQPSVVPLPGALSLLLGGLGIVGAMRLRRRPAS